jgi:hypothetical protein
VFGTEGFDYPVSILLGTSLLFALFKGEQHLLSTADRSGNT